jgi:hypothetical protein
VWCVGAGKRKGGKTRTVPRAQLSNQASAQSQQSQSQSQSRGDGDGDGGMGCRLAKQGGVGSPCRSSSVSSGEVGKGVTQSRGSGPLSRHRPARRDVRGGQIPGTVSSVRASEARPGVGEGSVPERWRRTAGTGAKLGKRKSQGREGGRRPKEKGKAGPRFGLGPEDYRRLTAGIKTA